jgi:hypothetical protein
MRGSFAGSRALCIRALAETANALIEVHQDASSTKLYVFMDETSYMC